MVTTKHHHLIALPISGLDASDPTWSLGYTGCLFAQDMLGIDFTKLLLPYNILILIPALSS